MFVGIKRYIKNEPIQFKKFWLEDEENIDKRIYVSASPNKEIIKNNKIILGEIYRPIKVRDLIINKWLCDIEPNIFDSDVKKNTWASVINPPRRNNSKSLGTEKQYVFCLKSLKK